jgi:hypothetical protein
VCAGFVILNVLLFYKRVIFALRALLKSVEGGILVDFFGTGCTCFVSRPGEIGLRAAENAAVLNVEHLDGGCCVRFLLHVLVI